MIATIYNLGGPDLLIILISLMLFASPLGLALLIFLLVRKTDRQTPPPLPPPEKRPFTLNVER